MTDSDQAHRDISEAIERLIRLDPDNDGAILVDWVLVTAATKFDGDSPVGRTACDLYAGPNAVPHYRLRGLLYEGIDRADESLEDEDE